MSEEVLSCVQPARGPLVSPKSKPPSEGEFQHLVGKVWQVWKTDLAF